MFHLDNSETSWLVYADWLEDQDIDAAYVRELNPITNDWHFAYRKNEGAKTVGVKGKVGPVKGVRGEAAGVGGCGVVGVKVGVHGRVGG